MKTNWKAKISHNENTIKLLYKTQRNVYKKRNILVRLALGLILVVFAFTSGVSILLQVVLLGVGAWLLVGYEFPSSIKASDTIEAREGKFPTINYTFSEHGVTLEDGLSTYLNYKKFQRLVEDDGYLYLFEDENSVCMVDKSTIDPKSISEFKDFLEERSKCSWEQNKSIFSMNLQDVKTALKGQKGKK